MPLVDFCCDRCGSEVEAIVKMGQDSYVCVCGNMMVKKWKASNASFRLKGSGWYKDGYK